MTKDHIESSREAFERAVIARMKESGFLEIEIRVEALVRCGDGYEDEVINAGWHYWKAGIAAASPPVVALPDDATAEEILKSTIDHPNAVVMLKRLPDARASALEEAAHNATCRPTPVAPVSPVATGKCEELVTVRYEIVETLPSGTTRWKCVEHEHHANSVAQMLEHPTTVNALVRRSQAEELLAAKDKQIALAETSMLEMHQDLNKLEAELAAERAEKEIAERNRDAARDNFLTMQKSAAKLLERAEKAEADNARQAARIKELEGHIYVPGSWHCPKCKFTLQQMVMSAQDCSVAPQEKPGEPCPNCQSPLWRVTWKQDAMEMSDRVEEQMNATKALEAKLAAAIPPSGEGA